MRGRLEALMETPFHGQCGTGGAARPASLRRGIVRRSSFADDAEHRRRTHNVGVKGPVVTQEPFEIVIRGTLSEPVLELIDGFEISKVERGETHLVGLVPDQSRLQGILTMFGNLNIELVSVNPLEQ